MFLYYGNKSETKRRLRNPFEEGSYFAGALPDIFIIRI